MFRVNLFKKLKLFICKHFNHDWDLHEEDCPAGEDCKQWVLYCKRCREMDRLNSKCRHCQRIR
jgi:hypothetical protein